MEDKRMLCPKCHQPLDQSDDNSGEQYICCAHADLAWRCTQCAKVSEGFAFPYGMCPYCGGRLEALGERAIEEPRALAGIRTAFEIELGGRAFYTRAAAESGDAELRELFSRFAAMEEEHMATLARRYHATVPPTSQSPPADRVSIYAGIKSRPEDPFNLFRIAIALEERAARFFLERATAATAGSIEQQLYRELAAEEREHSDLLSTELQRLTAGKTGML
jgi:rubrerythrin